MKKNNKGFTFIEVMGVLIIFGLILSYTAPIIQAKARSNAVNAMKYDASIIKEYINEYRKNGEIDILKSDNPNEKRIRKTNYHIEGSNENKTKTCTDVRRGEILYYLENKLISEITIDSNVIGYDEIKTIIVSNPESQRTGINIEDGHAIILCDSLTYDKDNIGDFKVYTVNIPGITLNNNLSDYAYEPLSGKVFYRQLIKGADGAYYTGQERIELEEIEAFIPIW